MADERIARVIDLTDKEQVAEWCARLECTQAVLKEAVRTVGPGFVLVQQWISWRNLR